MRPGGECLLLDDELREMVVTWFLRESAEEWGRTVTPTLEEIKRVTFAR